MQEGLGFGRRRLVSNIVTSNWDVEKPEVKTFSYNELLYVIQELLTEEGKQYFEPGSAKRGHHIFRNFVKHLLYRNLANYDSMVLVTSEKGFIIGDTLLEMPRDLKKYPKGIPLKELEGKGPQWVYSFNTKTKKLELKKCDGIEYVKTDDVWEIELTNGMKISATSDHPFLQIDGSYKQLKDLIWNAHKFKSGKTKGQIIYNRKGAKNTDRLQMVVRFGNSLLNDSFRIHYGIKPGLSKKEKNQKEHNFIYEQLFGNIPYDSLINHRNGNHYDNRVENLKLVTKSENTQIHSNGKLCDKGKYINYKRPDCKTRVGSIENKQLHSIQRKEWIKNNPTQAKEFHNNSKKIRINASRIQNGGIIKNIKYLGKKDVLDVVNVQDNHNFIVNGFVVSNTGKSSAAIMMAREWCRMIGIRFNPSRHIAYNNSDIANKIEVLNKFEPIVADEAIRFASSEDWNKKENKSLKKKLAQVRTKHLFYILCFPLKIQKVDKVYLEANVNYWIDLFGRGKGAIYVKDKNPVTDSWRMKEFTKMGSYTEFTNLSKVEQTLKKHPNFWNIIKFPRPPAWLYTRYLKVREKNVYDDENLMANVSKEDIHNALLILSLRDIMMHDDAVNLNRLVLHVRNEYDIPLTKGMIQAAIEDAKQLVAKVRETAMGV